MVAAASPDLIREAALIAFLEHGFHGTSVRDIAGAAGMSVAGLYHHFPSKVDILFDLMSRTMDDLIGLTEQALAGTPGSPADQLRAIVETHVLFHTERRAESFVGNWSFAASASRCHRGSSRNEIGSSGLFDQVVVSGAERGLFGTPYPLDASRAVVTMCTAVAGWYREGGPLSPSEIARRYADLALATVGFSETRAAPAGG